MKFTAKRIKEKELFVKRTLEKIAILAIRSLVGVKGEEAAVQPILARRARRRRGQGVRKQEELSANLRVSLVGRGTVGGGSSAETRAQRRR